MEIVGKEFDGVEGSMGLTLWSTLFVCCGLYAYIIFDTIADAIGWLPSTSSFTYVLSSFYSVVYEDDIEKVWSSA